MLEPRSDPIEKVGVGLVCSVETYRGCNIQLVKKTSGFNGLSTNKNGEVRKIEVKTMEKSFNWIAINGLTAIDKLFFERDYWIYFVLLPQNYVVMTRGIQFVRQQLAFSANGDFLENLEEWMKATRRLTRKSGLKFFPRLHVKFPVAVDKLVEHLLQHPEDTQWHNSVVEIWQNRETWELLYHAPEED